MSEKNERKKIAFYIGSLRKGGAERVFVNLADYFQSEGYRVVMVTQYQKEEEYDLPDGIVRILSDIEEEKVSASRAVNFFKRLNKLHVIWKEQKPDLVLSCIGKNNFMAVVTAMGTKTKAVVSVVGEAKEEYPSKGMRMLADVLFSCAAGKSVPLKKFFPEEGMRQSMSSSEHRGVPEMSYPAKAACSVGEIAARCRTSASEAGLHLG